MNKKQKIIAVIVLLIIIVLVIILVFIKKDINISPKQNIQNTEIQKNKETLQKLMPEKKAVKTEEEKKETTDLLNKLKQ